MSKNKKLGTYPGILITISLTLALFLIGFCGWFALSTKELISYVRQNIEVQVYLDRNIEMDKVEQIRRELAELPQLKISKIEYISKDSIATNFMQETSEKYEEVLGDNPFRDAFTINLNQDLLEGNKIENLKKEIEEIDGVFELDYAKDFIDGIIENANKAYLILSAIVLIFLIATLLLINNTIKLALYSQRFIIKTMQLVGATNGFIQKPFLIKGVVQGLIAGSIAAALVFITQQLAINELEGLSLIQNNEMMLILAIVLLVMGPLIGFLSTFQSITRYLNLDLDDLY
ncbi:cell division transport system permease protein [Spirosomataceae bacterium TFI 002]|nr:cell division transport system permease protein [Spirosomataceae bacterium TFI 002]